MSRVEQHGQNCCVDEEAIITLPKTASSWNEWIKINYGSSRGSDDRKRYLWNELHRRYPMMSANADSPSIPSGREIGDHSNAVVDPLNAPL
jgi:hypothetical protein